MNGKLKVLSLSQDIKGLKEKKVYDDVVIHFRDLTNHTITLKNDKKFVLTIEAMSIEANSLLFEGDVYEEHLYTGEVAKDKKPLTVTELRFYPNLTSKQG